MRTPERRAMAAALVAHLDRLAAPPPPDDPEQLGADAAFRAEVMRLWFDPEALTDDELAPLERAAFIALARYASAGLGDGSLFGKLMAAGEIHQRQQQGRKAAAASLAKRQPAAQANRREAAALRARGLTLDQIATRMDTTARQVQRWLGAESQDTTPSRRGGGHPRRLGSRGA